MKRKEKPTVEFSGEAKHAIAMAFEGAGGLKKLIAWAKTHPAVFYTQIYTKLLPMQVNANATVSHRVDEEQLRANLHDGLSRIIEARKRTLLEAQERGATLIEAPPPDPNVPLNIHTMAEQIIGVTIENEQSSVVIIDNCGPADAPKATVPEPAVPDIQRSIERDSRIIINGPKVSERQSLASPPQSPKPAPPHVVRSRGPSVPGLAAGAALGEGMEDNLSTTERFLLWRGHGGKMP